MSTDTNAQTAADLLLQLYQAAGGVVPDAETFATDIERVALALSGPDDSALLQAILDTLEGLMAMTVDISTALTDLNSAITADTAAKDALKATIADLQAQLAAAGQSLTDALAADVTDKAAAEAALAQVQDAANQVEAAAQQLNPLPAVPVDGGTPAPADVPAATTPVEVVDPNQVGA